MSKIVVCHIPHASMFIPDVYRSGIILSDNDLQKESIWHTDMYTDEIFYNGEFEYVIANVSRFVCDVERFRDDRFEVNAKKGFGLFYTHLLNGRRIRFASAEMRNRVIREIYDPHHTKLTNVVNESIQHFGRCVIVDCHSFCDDIILGKNLPDFCIGVDEYHTPPKMVDAVVKTIEENGYTQNVNYPFKGSLVPERFYNKDRRVASIMIEVNKRLYLQSDMKTKSIGFEGVKIVCQKILVKVEDLTKSV